MALLTLAKPTGASAVEEQAFNSPPAAVQALVAAATGDNTNALHVIFGPAGHALISPDAVEANAGFKVFVHQLAEKTQLITNTDASLTLEIGTNGWTFPIPLVQQEWSVVFRHRCRQPGDSQPPHRPG